MEYRMLSRSLLFCLVLEVILLKARAQTSITPRKPSTTVAEGSSLTLEWDFSLQSSDSLREIVFGLWEKGYTSSFFITVTQSRGAVVNPELSKKHPSYVGRVFWVGNISRSYAAFRLDNTRLSDSKTYGCQLGVGGFGQTRDSKMSLVVEKSSLDGKGSAFLHVPLARVGIVGQIAEFEWEYQYDTSVANGGDVKIVQFSKRSNPQTKPRILWKFQDNVKTTIPEYAERLFVSNVTRNEREKYPIERYTFKLFKVNTNDEGYYELNVGFTNEEMDLDSRVSLDVHVRPRIITNGNKKNTGSYKEDERLLLACETEGGTTPNIRWMKNGELMPGEQKDYFSVENLSKNDTGVYSCCAYYPNGNVSSMEVLVRVQYAPWVNTPSTSTILSWKGNPTNLTCSAMGDPAANFSWTRADEKLPAEQSQTSTNTSVLTIIPLADSDFSNYTCTAYNGVGKDSKVFILKPISPPSPPIITHIDVTHNTIKVEWNIPTTKQTTPITGYVLRIKKQGHFTSIEVTFQAKSNYYILGNLTRGSNYTVWLYATNVAGRSNASEGKQVETLINGCPGPPKLHFSKVNINCTTFLATWRSPGDNGGVEVKVNRFTVWYRLVVTNNTKGKWLKFNTTKTNYYVTLECCSTYEIMVTAWKRNCPSMADPDNAAKVTVLKDLPCNDKIRSQGLQGYRSFSREDPDMRVVNFSPVAAVLILPIIAVLVCLSWSNICKKQHFNVVQISGMEGPGESEMEELVSTPVPHVPTWEFPLCNLAIERVIGNGAFGVVSKAYARHLPDKPDEWTIVAVKSLQDDATESERKDLVSELNLLKRLKPHPYIIRLLGCVTTEPDGPFVIIEYVPYGDLLGYLRRSRGATDRYYDEPEIEPTTNLTSQQMLKYAWQISEAMRYIASKKILHRDLAARNVLVGENHRCKITDFGMARDVNLKEIYVPRSQGRIPVKWTAIEAMTGAMKYSIQSDVWSFGVVLFEICTIGAEPYPGISPWTLPNVLLKGYRMPKPEYVRDELYAIMMDCWEIEPENRPSFDSLCNKIKRLEMGANQNYVNIRDCLEAHENELA